MNSTPILSPAFLQYLFSHNTDMPLRSRRTPCPHSEINEDEKQYNIEISVPGMSKDDLQINLEDRYLYISSKRTDNKENKGKKTYKYNFVFFIRQKVDITQTTAELSKGILQVVLPKKEPKTSNSIEIIEKHA